MNLQLSRRIRRLPWQYILVYLAIALTATAITSCRDKSSVGPDTTNTPVGTWRIILSHDGQHLQSANDTISVRVYDTNNLLAGDVTVLSTNAVDSLHVSPTVVTITDTLARPWGTSPVMVYWGTNSAAQFDTIHSKAVVDGIVVADTLTVISLIGDF